MPSTACYSAAIFPSNRRLPRIEDLRFRPKVPRNGSAGFLEKFVSRGAVARVLL